jgi:type I restriction enzyme, S subunit
VKRIADIASSKSDKNFRGEALPVLTCSKRVGFVDSLRFFKNQVFSKDLSTYKVIQRGEIGYPSNHIEEGSIGLQNLYDKAIVSPIYVVFAVADNISSYFIHRLLKLDSYRQKFKTATTSSVDRRGSLRWPAFSDITVSLPSFPEQTAIAGTLSDMDAELSALEARRDKTRALKQAMMQELLTGRTRLV